MSFATPWTDLEQRTCAAQLYAALAALVGDVESLYLTGASLSWRTPAGVQGHWREAQGELWLGRIIMDRHGGGTQSTQLVLALARVADAAAGVRAAHPTGYHQRSVDGLVVGHDPDTPAIYEAALALLTQLREELQAMLSPARTPQEERHDA